MNKPFETKAETCYYVYDQEKRREVEFVLETTYRITPREKETRNHPGTGPAVEIIEAQVIGVGAGGGTAYFDEPVDAIDYFQIEDYEEVMPEFDFFYFDAAAEQEQAKIDLAEKRMEERREKRCYNSAEEK